MKAQVEVGSAVSASVGDACIGGQSTRRMRPVLGSGGHFVAQLLCYCGIGFQ